MIRMVLEDYRMDFGEALRREFREGTSLFWVVWFSAVVFMDFFENSFFQSGWKIASFILCYPCYVLLLCMPRMYPNRLGKMMYLLPVSGEERRRYLFTGFCCRVFVSGVVTAAGGVVLTLTGVFAVRRALAFGVLLFLFCVLHNLYPMMLSEITYAPHGVLDIFIASPDTAIQQYYKKNTLRRVFYVSAKCALIAGIIMVVYLFMETGKPMTAVEKNISCILSFLLAVLCVRGLAVDHVLYMTEGEMM